MQDPGKNVRTVELTSFSDIIPVAHHHHLSGSSFRGWTGSIVPPKKTHETRGIRHLIILQCQWVMGKFESTLVRGKQLVGKRESNKVGKWGQP